MRELDKIMTHFANHCRAKDLNYFALVLNEKGRVDSGNIRLISHVKPGWFQLMILLLVSDYAKASGETAEQFFAKMVDYAMKNENKLKEVLEQRDSSELEEILDVADVVWKLTKK